MVKIYRKEAAEVRCRFGCEGPIGIYHVPKGCICWEDPVQALCAQHYVTAESEGPITCVVDLRVKLAYTAEIGERRGKQTRSEAHRGGRKLPDARFGEPAAPMQGYTILSGSSAPSRQLLVNKQRKVGWAKDSRDEATAHRETSDGY